MKTAIIMFCLLPVTAMADQYVNGYTKSDGTYVQPHYRSDPNSNRYDNYSSQGNTNPYTGQQGTKSNEFSNPPVYSQPNPPPAYQGNDIFTPR